MISATVCRSCAFSALRRSSSLCLAGNRVNTFDREIRARVDYVNSLQENLMGQEVPSDEVRAEFKALVEQCRAALRNRADEND
jgi:hypothetical protein